MASVQVVPIDSEFEAPPESIELFDRLILRTDPSHPRLVPYDLAMKQLIWSVFCQGACRDGPSERAFVLVGRARRGSASTVPVQGVQIGYVDVAFLILGPISERSG